MKLCTLASPHPICYDTKTPLKKQAFLLCFLLRIRSLHSRKTRTGFMQQTDGFAPGKPFQTVNRSLFTRICVFRFP